MSCYTKEKTHDEKVDNDGAVAFNVVTATSNKGDEMYIKYSLVLVLIGMLSAPMVTCCAAGQVPDDAGCTSQLWGEAGELWSPISRLPDYSYCGYQYGEKAIPRLPVVATVSEFGADGSDDVDDTESIKAAIEHVSRLPLDQRGAILFPAGKYIVSQQIQVAASGVVIRGAGPHQTEVYFTDLDNVPTPPSGEWSDAWLATAKKEHNWGKEIATRHRGFLFGNDKLSLNIFRLPAPENVQQFPVLTKPGNPDRGSDFILLSPKTFRDFTAAFATNEAVVLVAHINNRKGPQRNDRPGGNAVMQELTGGAWGDDKAAFGVSHRLELRISAMADNRVTFDRTIRIPYGDSPVQPKLYKCDKEFTECGIEDISLNYSTRPYISHFMTTGRSPLKFMHTVRHAWARNIVISNADHGIGVNGRHITLSDIVVRADRGSSLNPHYERTTGHVGIALFGSDNLVERFRIDSEYVHNLSVSHSFGCVFSQGSGVDINFDHHRKAPYENLFVEIDIGKGSKPFSSSGRSEEGPQIGAYNTYWNIRSEARMEFPDRNDWSQAPIGSGLINIVGVNSDRPSLLGPRRWMETMPPKSLRPQNIYKAQLAKRLGKQE